MRHGIMSLALAGLLAVPAGLSAQQPQQHHPQGQPDRPQQQTMRQDRMEMGQHGMGMMGHAPQFILRQKEALNLNPSQVQQLEALQKQLADAREAHIKEAEPLRTQAMDAMHADEPDLGKYESALEGLAEHHVKMQVDAARISQQALDVLTPEQHSNVRYAMRLMRDIMGGRMMDGGMMGEGMMMQRGMMGDCPMMMDSMGGDGR